MRKLMRDTPLSLRLTALYVAILIIVLGILGGVIYVQVESFLLRDVQERNLTGARNAVNRAAPFRRGNGFPGTVGGGTIPVYGATPVNGGGPTSGNGEGQATDVNRLSDILREVSSRETTAQIFGTDCTLLAVTTQAIPDQPIPPACDVAEVQRALIGPVQPRIVGTEEARAMVLLVPLSLNGGTPGVLQITTSLAAADSLLARLRLILLLGAGGAIVIGAALGVSVTRTALRPLARITATSELIAAGDLGERTNLPAGRDELGRLATAFDRMVDRLEGTLRAQQQFVADASHELRTPLTALGGLIEMLLLGADRGDTKTMQRALRSAHAEIERLARLVGDLLTLSRLDAHPPLERRPFDLAALVADVGEQTRYIAGERTVSWQGDGPLPVEGDPDRLKQVLINLTGNAVAFTGETGRVTLRTMRRGEQAIIEVEDDGAGIDASDLPRLFERFYRGDKSRVRRADGGGNGLGLSIARAIVEAHGGTIDARSTIGAGTTFTIAIPVQQPSLAGETSLADSVVDADLIGSGR
jgi:two-component system OmpR family sensor kinase